MFKLTIYLNFFAFAIVFLNSVTCSRGDNLPVFKRCLSSCIQKECHPLDGSSLTPLPLTLRLTRWSCTDNCKYTCMIPIYEDMKKDSPETGPVAQFFGKWPFYRVLGIQELGSSVFSVMNGWMHYRGLILLRKSVPADSAYRSLYYLYSIISINTWVWSTIFHARDMRFTEHMDYFSAYLSILFSLYFTILRVFLIRPSFKSSAFIILSLLFPVAYIHHLITMTTKFDYFYNMLVGIIAGVVHNLLWVYWSVFQSDSPHPHPGRWLPPKCAGLITLALLFEVFDFAPIFGLIDAHSLWHLSTVFIIPDWYRFFVLDSNYLRNTEKSLGKQW